MDTTRRAAFAAVMCIAIACGGPDKAIEDSLREHVIFFSNFEKGMDALWSEGDTRAGLDGANTRHHLNDGVAAMPDASDGYLEFEEGSDALSYVVKTNFPYSESTWEGGVAFWLDVDPGSLTKDYPEPFHAGKKEGGGYPWDDGVIFVDFTKAPERSLRYGCYPNKADKDAELPDEVVAQHVIEASGVGWKADEWHHVAIGWKNFNSGQPNAEWALFVDGKEAGRKSGLQLDITWDTTDLPFRFNHYGYVGKIDEIAVFKKMLTPDEARYLHSPKRPLNVLLKKGP